MRTTIDRFGRVVVPKSMRERFGLRSGTVVEIEETGGCLSLRVVEDTSPLSVKEGVLLFTGKATGDIEAAVAADRRERAGRLAGMPSR